MVNLEIRERLPEGALVLDNHAYDNSILGVSLDGRVIYSFERMVDELMSDEGWDELTAIEWIEYNTVRALPYFGSNAPIIVDICWEE
jgi:hypothetical protein